MTMKIQIVISKQMKQLKIFIMIEQIGYMRTNKMNMKKLLKRKRKQKVNLKSIWRMRN
jgi:hypothetical protein